MKLKLQAREIAIRLYKQYELGILFVLRLFIGLIVFSAISNIGFERAEFEDFFTPPLAMPILLLLAVLYVLLPPSVSYAIMILDIGIQLSTSTEIMAIVVLFLLCVLFFYVRLAPQESFLILATLAAFYLRIPYLVPILAGLYCGVTALIPIGIGVFLWHFIPVVDALMMDSVTAGFNVMDMPATVAPIMQTLMESLTTNLIWVFTAFIFAMVVLAVHGIARLAINYAKEMSIGLGALLTVASFVIAQIMAQMQQNIAVIFFFTLLSAGLALIIRFFDGVLDYNRVERVEFEDEDNYYFVKVVPKVILTRRRRAPRRIRPAEEVEE
jgi:hypothetical protein